MDIAAQVVDIADDCDIGPGVISGGDEIIGNVYFRGAFRGVRQGREGCGTEIVPVSTVLTVIQYSVIRDIYSIPRVDPGFGIIVARFRRAVEKEPAIMFRDRDAVDYQERGSIIVNRHARVARGIKDTGARQDIAAHIYRAGFCPDRRHVDSHDVILDTAGIVKIAQGKGLRGASALRQGMVARRAGGIEAYLRPCGRIRRTRRQADPL